MADPTPEELAAAGVQVGAVSEVEPPRAAFVQISDLPDQPKTDVLIQFVDGGEKLRERMTRLPVEEGFAFSFSHAQVIDDSGTLAHPTDGTPPIVPPAARHEFVITGEDAGRMTPETIATAFQVQREVAAEKARTFFAGMELGTALFAARIDPPEEKKNVP